jgi:hypothetical protein
MNKISIYSESEEQFRKENYILLFYFILFILFIQK